jgi:hypothetical protein
MASVAAQFARECADLLERQAARADASAVVAIRPFAVADLSGLDAAEHNQHDGLRKELGTIFDKYSDRMGDAMYEAAAEVSWAFSCGPSPLADCLCLGLG